MFFPFCRSFGTCNFVKSLRLNDSDLIRLGEAMEALVMMTNEYISFSSPYSWKYLYANVTETEIYELKAFNDPGLFQSMIGNVHPTHAGHQYMAEQIVKLLPEQKLPFTDVAADQWYCGDVNYVWANGLMNGKTPTTFDPSGVTTRAEFATVLYRLAGSPAVTEVQKKACPFTDLTADWYRNAVAWAYDAKVVNGVSEKIFAPNQQITREQLVAMLYRYDGSKDGGDLSQLKDADAISEYARPAVGWAAGSGIVTGFPDGSFQPKGNATRAQMAAIIARFDRMEK